MERLCRQIDLGMRPPHVTGGRNVNCSPPTTTRAGRPPQWQSIAVITPRTEEPACRNSLGGGAGTATAAAAAALRAAMQMWGLWEGGTHAQSFERCPHASRPLLVAITAATVLVRDQQQPLPHHRTVKQ